MCYRKKAFCFYQWWTRMLWTNFSTENKEKSRLRFKKHIWSIGDHLKHCCQHSKNLWSQDPEERKKGRGCELSIWRHFSPQVDCLAQKLQLRAQEAAQQRFDSKQLFFDRLPKLHPVHMPSSQPSTQVGIFVQILGALEFLHLQYSFLQIHHLDSPQCWSLFLLPSEIAATSVWTCFLCSGLEVA